MLAVNALASSAAHSLAPYCRFVQNAAGDGGAEQAVRRLLRLDARDVVIGIATPRYSKDTVVEWVYRAARAARLVDGASEVHNMVLARFMREEGRDFWSWSAGNRV